MATNQIGMFSKMEKAIFHSAVFTQGGIFCKTEKSWTVIATHPKPQRKLIVAKLCTLHKLGKLCG